MRCPSVLAILSLLVLATTGSLAAGPQYPPTRRDPQVTKYHGIEVAEPYAWLEQDVRTSPEVAQWVEAQNRVTRAYLDAIPQRETIRRRLTELWNYARYSAPMKKAGRYYYSKNDGLQNQSVLYVMDSLAARPRVLIDPNQWSPDGTIALAGLAFSDDGRYVAFCRSEAGSDWKTWRVMEIASGRVLADELKWAKYSGAAWTKDGRGLFYGAYDAPRPGAAFQELNLRQKLLYHRLGTPQSDDLLVYRRPDEPEWGFEPMVTEDGRYLVVTVSKGTDHKYRVLYRDLGEKGDGVAAMAPQQGANGQPPSPPAPLPQAGEGRNNNSPAPLPQASEGRNNNTPQPASNMIELVDRFENEYSLVGNDGAVLFFKTDRAAPRGRLIAIDTRRPQREHWREIIPQAEEILTDVNLVGDRFIAKYLKDVKPLVKLFDMTGRPVGEIELPGIGSATGFGGHRADRETFYEFSSFATPPSIYRYDLATGRSELFRRAEVKFRPEDFEVRQVFYKSKDGTRVPMFLAYRKGMKPDGRNPTLLYGYGGFNISRTPTFSVRVLQWMEMGGVFAVANLRGGGEYGEAWHEAGKRNRKQNVFDDFIAAAQWLIDNRYTRPERLAIQGGSNGGLLVGAAMTQRPDLFGACLPAVGVMDMLRFHKFTAGRFWVDEFGSSESADEFRTLRAYSPYHNLRPGTRYPATLVTTADTDDRVVPGHSFKFIAALQHAQAGSAPVLIRIETRAGHGAGKPVSKSIDETADLWAFLVKNLAVEVKGTE